MLLAIQTFEVRATDKDVAFLAALLKLPETELTRELTQDENVAWDFYQQAARATSQPWSRIYNLWRHQGLPDDELATLLGVPTDTLPDLIAANPPRVLDYNSAKKLAIALKLPDGPTTLIASDTTGEKESQLQER